MYISYRTWKMNIINKNFDIPKFYDTLVLVDISVLVCLCGNSIHSSWIYVITLSNPKID